ncbi:MAG: serine protease Do [Marivirga sp.]|jgi:serine protease Do
MMNKKQFYLGVFLAAIFSAFLTIGGFVYFSPSNIDSKTFEQIQEGNAQFSSYLDSKEYNVPEGINFIYAAEHVTKGVVHIKAEVRQDAQRGGSPFEEFFREFHGGSPYQQERKTQSQGSGVIISPDGYIVTNNHVIEGASEVQVRLSDNREYVADIIGTDLNTDITLLKIDAKDLIFVEFGDSDKTKIGEWVLAVGNPFNLTSTVTAGIVSAKARSINILSGRTPYGIESFIQTDAAVNPGNSGGALVNLKGELIGINTAIASPTGSFAGYSFAVPSILVNKVVNDIKEFGVVQRAVLGVGILDVNDPRVGKELDVNNGVYVSAVNPESAAQLAGIKIGDIIVNINGTKVDNVAELQELVARNSPGDKVKVTYLRDGKEKTVSAELKNIMNNVELVKVTKSQLIDGATFEDVSAEVLEELKIDSGAKITALEGGKWKNVGVKEGFIVTAIDKVVVIDAADLTRILETKRGGILIEGIYPDGTKAYFGMGWQ